MESQQLRNVLRLAAVVWHVVSCQPEFIHPKVNQQHSDKARQIEEIFLDRNPFPQRGCCNLQRRSGIWEGKEMPCKEEVQRAPSGHEDADSSPKSLLGNFDSLLRHEP